MAADKIPWQTARIGAIASVTPRVKSFRFEGLAGRHRAGQHVEVRLTAPDGYSAQRSYSIASAPGDAAGLELMIEGLEQGEVSSYFAGVAEVGDEVELRGPIGGSFVWSPEDEGPVLLVGGGSGVVPLLAMIRARFAARSETPMLLIYSVRNLAEAIALDELQVRARDAPGFDLTLLTTREGATAGRRIDRVMIETALDHVGKPRHVFVCGSNGFVGSVSDLLVDAAVKPGIIRTERFGG
ncbi:FAD-binding oxidoreductase [Methylobacterium haplocladii]|uniref:Oxidoreductase n=1 Tax=Methylobacterium haplocladii TaxID=1176176 RepID=A0A512IND4_9HYPH|nr:FAD-binding oxidoreductase [Methylobacterium haplocladii]GEO99223.1 oxidoreductase [Methylobacterium haplocladii]GJD83713.1 Benzoate 1,2-dioxygenase electron transfer component [Methylobacterium haplocladii]GLS59073.1 oxidoreductase [Methylobacterium haplocladii]